MKEWLMCYSERDSLGLGVLLKDTLAAWIFADLEFCSGSCYYAFCDSDIWQQIFMLLNTRKSCYDPQLLG